MTLEDVLLVEKRHWEEESAAASVYTHPATFKSNSAFIWLIFWDSHEFEFFKDFFFSDLKTEFETTVNNHYGSVRK